MPSSGHDADGALGGLRDHEKERAASRYERLEELGRGAMAVVYRARDRQLDRFVAMKLLLDEKSLGAHVLKRFSREAAAAARLSHPNIVQVHDAGEDGGRPFIVMELVEGRTLADAFHEWDLRKRIEALRKVALAIQHAHEHGVVHRDLKPQNILVDAAGEPRVSDFGLAHLSDSAEALTRTGAQLGTPVYMAPEQAMGHVHDIDAQSDVWALGVMVYEAVSGSVPFIGGSVMEVFHRITASEPPPARSLNPRAPRDLETIALKAMEKEKRRRTATAAEVAADLGRWLAGEPIHARPVGTITMLVRRAGRYRTAILAVLLAVAAGAGWVAYVRTSAPISKRRDADRALDPARKAYEDALVSLYNDQAPMDDLAMLAQRGIESCDAALAIFRDHEEAVYLRGRLKALAGDEAGAEADFTRAAALGVKAALLDRGRLRLERLYDVMHEEPNRRELRRTEEARKAARADLDGARAAGLGDEDALCAEALVAVVEGRPDAKERCEAFLARARRKELGHWLMGTVLLTSDAAAAEASFSEAIRWRRKWDRAWLQRGIARTTQGRAVDGMADLRKAIDLNPRQVVARLALGHLLHLARRDDEAMAVYDTALKLAPTYAQLHLNIGNVWARRGDFPKALKAYETALTYDPGEIRAVLNIARVHLQRGDPGEALRQCDVALAIDAASAMAYVNRGQAKRDLGDRAGAVADFRKSVEVDPKCAPGLEEMGRSAGSPQEAIDWYAKALDADPSFHSARVSRAQCLCVLRRIPEAEVDFADVLDRDPDHAGALRGRGTLRFETGAFEAAIVDFTRVLEKDASDEIARYMRGASCIKLSRWKEALADFEKVEQTGNAQIRERVHAVLPELRRRAGE